MNLSLSWSIIKVIKISLILFILDEAEIIDINIAQEYSNFFEIEA